MGLEIVRLRPGPEAVGWLVRRVAGIQRGDALAPVTVVVPSHHAGLFLRRRLATVGYANVRFALLTQLAEAIGAGAVARQGRTPLTAIVRNALVRDALRAAGEPLASAADDAGLVDLVAALAAELRRRPDREAVERRIAGAGGRTPSAAFAAVGIYEDSRRGAGLADDVDILDAAGATLRGGGATAALREVGPVVAFLPPALDSPALALLEAVAAHSAVTVAEVAVAVDGSQPFAPGDVAPRVMIAPEPVAEVRAAVRDLLAAAERPAPIPLHRTAIVYGDEETYAALVRDTLDEAGVAFASLDGRRLADTTPARGLLGLIRLRDLDFTRAAVLAWLSGLPHRGSGVLRSQARWDHLSRDAGVVRGAAQWRDRLERYAQGRERALAGLESDEEEAAVEARRSALRHEIDDARAVAVHVAAIDAATAPPAEPAWTAHVEWALRLRDEFLTPDVWSDADREASQMVEEVVRALAAAEAVEPAVSIRLFLRSLEEGLRSRRLPEGRLGGGVVIGPPGLLLGMELARVHVLGAVEGGLPAPAPVDPLLPGDPLGRQATREAEQRRDWLATLAVADGGEVVVSAPAVDAEGRAVYPSPWLLELLAEGGVAPRATEVRAGTFAHPRVERTGGGPGAPRAAPLSIAERREAEAMAGVAGSALAGRADLPLGRLLAVAGARRSPELTEFDGDLAEVGDLDLVARGLCGAVQSATGIETWATCPFHFLLGRVLAVRPTEDVDDDRWWQIDAAERGLLVHAILETFFTEVAKTGQPRPGEHYTDADVARIEAIALRAFGDAEARGVVGHPLVWANERSAILADLRSLLREDAGRRGDGGWRPSRLEQPFGIEGDARSWPAVEVALDAGRTVTLRGFIDRIDVDGAGTPRVIDYKTGTNSRPDVSAKSRFDGGRRLQLPLYGRAVRDDLRRQGMLPMAARATYWYATAKGGFDQVGLDVDGGVEDTLSEVLRLVDAGVRAGCFPQEPGEFLEYFARYANCGFCPYDTLCPAGRDVLAAAKAGSPALQPYHALRPPVGDGS